MHKKKKKKRICLIHDMFFINSYIVYFLSANLQVTQVNNLSFKHSMAGPKFYYIYKIRVLKNVDIAIFINLEQMFNET